MLLACHLLEDCLGNIAPAPIGCTLGVDELVHEVATGPASQILAALEISDGSSTKWQMPPKEWIISILAGR